MVQNVLNLQKVLITRIQKEKLFRRDFLRTLPTKRYSLQLTSENGPQALFRFQQFLFRCLYYTFHYVVMSVVALLTCLFNLVVN